MRKQTTPFLEKARVKTGQFRSDARAGFNGAFFLANPKNPTLVLKVICSDGEGWEHVSVSLPGRCPTWDEMCWVKDLFWEEEEAVMQLHPPKSEWVNNVLYCLHLWRPALGNIPLPPQYMVGVKGLGVLGGKPLF